MIPIHESELKFVVPRDRRAALEQVLRRGSVRVERLQALYFDTADERLAAHGIALRMRKEGRRWVQAAKASTADALRRLEHEVRVTAPPGGGAPALDPARHRGSPAGVAMCNALAGGGRGGGGDHHRDRGDRSVERDADADGAALSMRFRTDVKRTTRIVRVPGARIELALDIGRIVAGARSLPICEFELELKSGRVDALVGAAAQWAGRHGLWLSTVSKSERGARLARGDLEAGPVAAEALHVNAAQGLEAVRAAALRNCLAQVLGNGSEIAAGAGDERIVHQMRIGLRRLRTALRELGPPAGAAEAGWEPVLRSAFEELGEHRNFASVVPGLRAELLAAGAPSWPVPEAAHPVRSPQAIVRDPAFQRVLLEILARGEPPAAVHAGDGRPAADHARDVRKFVAARLEALRRRIERDGKRFASLDVERQHRVRKRLKRLRYLGEFAAPLFGARRVARYLAAWRDAQGALGRYNDQRVAAAEFAREAETQPQAWFGVGWLAARRRIAVKRCERALREAAKTRPFWHE